MAGFDLADPGQQWPGQLAAGPLARGPLRRLLIRREDPVRYPLVTGTECHDHAGSGGRRHRQALRARRGAIATRGAGTARGDKPRHREAPAVGRRSRRPGRWACVGIRLRCGRGTVDEKEGRDRDHRHREYPRPMHC